jgi:hypothetical protein
MLHSYYAEWTSRKLHSYYALCYSCDESKSSRSISRWIENKACQQRRWDWRMVENRSTTPQIVGEENGEEGREGVIWVLPYQMGSKEHVVLWVTSDELAWPSLGHAKVSGMTQSDVALLTCVDGPAWHWIAPIALSQLSSISRHDDRCDQKGLELKIKFIWDHFWNNIFKRAKIGGKSCYGER